MSPTISRLIPKTRRKNGLEKKMSFPRVTPKVIVAKVSPAFN